MSDQIGHDKPCFMYRLYDSTGRLLYAGSTTDVKRRMAEHKMSKFWYADVSRVEADEYPSRWRAALAERDTGRGKYGGLPGGISKGIAAAMSDEELMEALSHPAYADWGSEAIARTWGIKIGKVRELRANVDRMAVRGWLGKR